MSAADVSGHAAPGVHSQSSQRSFSASREFVVRYPRRQVDLGVETPRPGKARVYTELVKPAYGRFRQRLVGWSDPGTSPMTPADGPVNIGLLTFPNSGTSWFARVAMVATGICRHTVYRDESTRPVESRGVFALHPGGDASLPADDDPILVKSHVRFFAGAHNESVVERSLDDLAVEWCSHLPDLSGALRLVRNPVDNVRARYHHYIKKAEASGGQNPVSFSEFLTDDITNYLLWHTCCDLTLGGGVLSLDYDRLLAGDVSTFQTALRYAGYRIEDLDVAMALATHPPKYPPGDDSDGESEPERLPVHLDTYSVDDLIWLAERLNGWVDELEKSYGIQPFRSSLDGNGRRFSNHD